MNGPAHIVLGAGAAFAANYAWHVIPDQPLVMVLCYGAAIVGALLPDIDQNNSTIRHKTGTARGQGPLGWVGGIFAAVFGGHRGFTHTGLCLGLVGWLLWRYVPAWWHPIAMMGLVGYASHLVADMLTEGGIPLFWPLSARRIGLWRS
jgi:inner membrane protein